MNSIYPYDECRQYVELLQQNITRMATNSANCKAWLVAIIAGTFVISHKDSSLLTPLVEALIIVFGFLDSFYLGQERRLRKVEEDFVKLCKDSNSGGVRDALFTFKSNADHLNLTRDIVDCWFCKWFVNLVEQFVRMLCSVFSFSTSPFYVVLWFAIRTIMK